MFFRASAPEQSLKDYHKKNYDRNFYSNQLHNAYGLKHCGYLLEMAACNYSINSSDRDLDTVYGEDWVF